MFELIDSILGIGFFISFIIFMRKILNDLTAASDLEKKKVLALVNLREAITKLNEDFVNLEVDCLFKK